LKKPEDPASPGKRRTEKNERTMCGAVTYAHKGKKQEVGQKEQGKRKTKNRPNQGKTPRGGGKNRSTEKKRKRVKRTGG